MAADLMRCGALQDNDLGQFNTYTTASGSTAISRDATLREIIIGGHVLRNVEGSIGASAAYWDKLFCSALARIQSIIAVMC
jgi:hypothetical protein